jgi:pyruvate/2-oxoglutarate dehydrogenase complex dihydrolipoamide acyltransferase (E2) component
MSVDVIYPKVSLESDSGRVSRWLVAEGETVSAGQVLFEIENDKAAVEVEAPADGGL